MWSLAITTGDRSFMALYMLDIAPGTPTRLNIVNAGCPVAREYPSAIATHRPSWVARRIFKCARAIAASHGGLTPVPLPRDRHSAPAAFSAAPSSSPPVPRSGRLYDLAAP